MSRDEGWRHRTQVRKMPAQDGQRLLGVWKQQPGHIAPRDLLSLEREIRDQGDRLGAQPQGSETAAGEDSRSAQETQERVEWRRQRPWKRAADYTRPSTHHSRSSPRGAV